MSQTHHLSQAAYDRLKAELDELRTVGRTEIARKIEAAREMGDLSENGDYHAAKDAQGMMEARIAQLERILKNAIIVDAAGGSTVMAGSVVTILYDGDDEDMAETYLIGSIEEKRPGLDVITPGSALGSALIGRQPGDAVSYQAPNGATLQVKLLRVEA